MGTFIDLQKENGIGVITLKHPDGTNAITLESSKELLEVAIHCHANQEIRVVVIVGQGKVFSFGGDLKSFAGEGEEIGNHLREVTTYLHSALSHLVKMRKPVVAAVNGVAAGGGFSLLCSCDIVYAAASAKFTLAYTKAGLTPDGSSSYFLSRLIGIRKALELALTNQVLTSEEALQLGIINKITPDDQVMNQAMELARNLANGPIGAFGATKELFYSGLTNSLEEQLALESMTISNQVMTKEAQEGIAAFLEKRKPTFL